MCLRNVRPLSYLRFRECMCVCMYVCMYVCIYIYIYVCHVSIIDVSTRTYGCQVSTEVTFGRGDLSLCHLGGFVNICIYTYNTHVCIRLSLPLSLYIYIYIHMIHIYIYIYINIHLYVCMYVYRARGRFVSNRRGVPRGPHRDKH